MHRSLAKIDLFLFKNINILIIILTMNSLTKTAMNSSNIYRSLTKFSNTKLLFRATVDKPIFYPFNIQTVKLSTTRIACNRAIKDIPERHNLSSKTLSFIKPMNLSRLSPLTLQAMKLSTTNLHEKSNEIEDLHKKIIELEQIIKNKHNEDENILKDLFRSLTYFLIALCVSPILIIFTSFFVYYYSDFLIKSYDFIQNLIKN
jgi:hypothetical protein